MTSTDRRSPPGFRNEWLDAVVIRCQRFVGTVMVPDDTHSIPELASAFVEALPEVCVPAEDLALRRLLMDVAAGWGTSLHGSAHARPGRTRCSFDTWRTLEPFFREPRHGARDRFLEWARAFSIELSRTHPVPAARRAAAIIGERSGERVDAATLAHLIGVSPQQLRREFRQTFGVTLAKYERDARLLRALQVLRDQPGKIEPIALRVGYGSKKDFYRAFKQSVGMTPSAFLRLPPDEARRFVAAQRVGP